MNSFKAGYTNCMIALTCWFFVHPVAGIAFTITQHGLGFYFLGWYWLAIVIASTIISTITLRRLS